MTLMLHDFDRPVNCPPARRADRACRGLRNHLSGRAAEESVRRDYAARGFRLRAERWRGRAAEIDLIFESEDGLVFVEVKSAPTRDRAAQALRPAQIARIQNAALEYQAAAGFGPLTPLRFDAALVDGQGRVAVIENVNLH